MSIYAPFLKKIEWTIHEERLWSYLRMGKCDPHMQGRSVGNNSISEDKLELIQFKGKL
jgi:hypothetical protein